MPIPQQNKNERKDAFIERCMADDKMGKEYPINQQRFAVCSAQLKNAKKLKPYKSVKLQSYSDYPKAASENAKIALRYAEQNGWGTCGTSVGKIRANQLSKGAAISADTISKMASFERHRQNSQKELGDGCGRLMWLAWGGDEGIEWAQRKLEQIKNE
jgi:hypothetical protein